MHDAIKTIRAVNKQKARVVCYVEKMMSPLMQLVEHICPNLEGIPKRKVPK